MTITGDLDKLVRTLFPHSILEESRTPKIFFVSARSPSNVSELCLNASALVCEIQRKIQYGTDRTPSNPGPSQKGLRPFALAKRPSAKSSCPVKRRPDAIPCVHRKVHRVAQTPSQ